MSHIIQKFGDWKNVHENDDLGRIRERGDNRNKVVAIPVDKQTLKLKIVNDADVIDANDKLTVEGFDAILEWIKSQPKLIEYYPGLNKLDTNIVIYDVSKDTDRKQVIMFTIVSKISLQGSDQSVTGGINPQVRFVKRNELQLALKGALLNVKGGSNIVIDKSAPTFTLPYASAGILNATKAEVIQFITSAYKKIKKDPLAFNTPLMLKVRDEIMASKLGTASQLFVKSLNAGFGILDSKVGEFTEVDITKALYDKLQAISESKEVYLGLTATQIVETLSTVITGFDVDAFLAVAKTITPDTGDIKVPEGGFILGMKGNIELMKFQKFLYTKLKKAGWSTVAAYANFAAKTGDGKAGSPIGDYGKTTAALIEVLKTGLNKPFWDEREPNTISAEFVKRMQTELKSITESREPISYLGLDGNSVIINEDLGVPATAATVSTTPTYKPKAKSTSTPTKSTVPGNNPIYPKYEDWEFKRMNNEVWHFKKKGASDSTYTVETDPRVIQQLISSTRKGWFIRPSWDGKKWIWKNQQNRYRATPAKKWQVSSDGGKTWKEESASEQKILTSVYGSDPLNPGQAAPAKPKTITQATTKEIDAALKALGTSIYTYIDVKDGQGEANFGEYSGTGTFGNDQESEAWDNRLMPHWKSKWKPEVDRITKLVDASSAINNEDKTRYKTSLKTITGMFTDEVGDTVVSDDSFYGTFLGSTVSDTYTFQLLYAADSSPSFQRWSIATDF